jgi:hypothetical protein
MRWQVRMSCGRPAEGFHEGRIPSMRQIAVGLVVFALVGQVALPRAAQAEDSTLAQAGYGAGSVLGTLVYAPVMTAFCILGGIGAAGTAVASPSAARRVVGASCGGTWIITPATLRGGESVNFVGNARRA